MDSTPKTHLAGGCTINGKPIGRTVVYVRVARCSGEILWYRPNVGQLFFLDRVTEFHDRVDYAVIPAGPYLSETSHRVRNTECFFSFGFFTGGQQHAVLSDRSVRAHDADLIFVDEDTRYIARVIAHDGKVYEHDNDGENGPALFEYFDLINAPVVPL